MTSSSETPPSFLSVPGPAGEVAAAETRAGTFQAEVVARSHRFFADEPRSYGGLDSGPSPYDFLAAALASCTSMTLRLYADRKEIALERVIVRIRHDKVHAKDCAECDGREGRVDRFERELELIGDLDAAAVGRLREIADKCPVHRTLAQSSVIVTRLRGR